MKRILSIIALLIFISVLFSHAADAGPEYMLSVSFDPAVSKLTGNAKIKISHNRILVLNISGLSLNKITLNGRNFLAERRGETLTINPSEDGLLEIIYEAGFAGEENGNLISEHAISFTDVWYPQPQELMTYRLESILPKGFLAISEAERIESKPEIKTTAYTFYFDHPADHLTFIASDKYKMVKDKSGDTDLYAYFFEEDIGLAKEYIEHAKGYLDLYKKMVGRYPYSRFSIVENISPTGYSMPTYTLLGRDVVRLPFIVKTSLGHEILHQWFGNSVYIDYGNGNWAEGLTTYLADYLYEDLKGRGAEYRKQVLIDYQAYVNEKNVFPLSDFRGRTDYSSKAIGYGKCAMLFHMLKLQIGEEKFHKAIGDFVRKNSFRKASWDDVRSSFEAVSNENLKPVFRQWIDRTDIPELQAGNASVIRNGDGYKISFELIQRNQKPYVLTVPLTVYAAGKKASHSFKLYGERTPISIYSQEKPERILVDEDSDLMRALAPEEFPPVIARLIGDETLLIVLPASESGTYKQVIDTFSRMGAMIKKPSAVDESVLGNHSLIILGNDNPVIDRIKTPINRASAGFNISVIENPFNRFKVLALIDSGSSHDTELAFPKIFHYGKYSRLEFRKGRNILKETTRSDKGIPVKIPENSGTSQ